RAEMAWFRLAITAAIVLLMSVGALGAGYGFHIQEGDRVITANRNASRLVPSPKPYVFERSYEFLGFNGPQDIFYDEDRQELWVDRKSTRLNSSHVKISYAVLCLKKKNNRE